MGQSLAHSLCRTLLRRSCALSQQPRWQLYTRQQRHRELARDRTRDMRQAANADVDADRDSVAKLSTSHRIVSRPLRAMHCSCVIPPTANSLSALLSLALFLSRLSLLLSPPSLVSPSSTDHAYLPHLMSLDRCWPLPADVAAAARSAVCLSAARLVRRTERHVHVLEYDQLQRHCPLHRLHRHRADCQLVSVRVHLLCPFRAGRCGLGAGDVHCRICRHHRHVLGRELCDCGWRTAVPRRRSCVARGRSRDSSWSAAPSRAITQPARTQQQHWRRRCGRGWRGLLRQAARWW